MNKLKFLSWFALTVFSATVWAGTQEGPWTYDEYASGRYDKTNSSYYARSYNSLNNQWWGKPRQWGDSDGIGLTIEGSSGSKEKQCTYSIYHATVNVASFSRQRLNWTFKLGAFKTKHNSITSLYGGFTNLNVVANTSVDCTENYSDGSGSTYRLLDPFKHTADGQAYTGEVTKTFYFDNSTGTSAVDKSNYLLLVHVITSGDKGKDDLHEWGAFKHVSMTWGYDYYKHITFNGNGATSGSMGNQTIENSGNLKANAFSRTGYTYDGWATSATGGKVYNNQASIYATSGDKGNVTLYAHWNANKYTVSFNQQSGTGGLGNITATYDANMPTVSVPTRTGYTFQGYFDAASGGTRYYNANGTSARTWNKASNATLHAQWKANTYTVNFNKQNGTGGSASVTATYNANMPTATMPTRTGYTFNGYFDAASGGNQYYKANGSSARTWNKTANTTLYAQWTANKYTVTFDKQNGTGGSNNVSATYDAAMPAATMPTRTGYTFQGYYDAQTGGNQYYKADGSSAKNWDKTANTTLYARWDAITYTITYDYAKGKGNNPATYNPDMATFDLAAPTRLGYTFLGWTGSNGTTPQTIVTIATGSVGDKNYVAHWAIDPNTPVVYKDSLDNTEAQEIVAFNRPEAPEVAGFTFVRWDVVEGPLSEGIKLQAIYTENEPSGAPKRQVGKFTLIRKGDKNEYILQTAK